MRRIICFLLGMHLIIGCDSDLHRMQDSGPDADVPDTSDMIDVKDVSDVTDMTDTTDASGYPEGFPAPSCDEDPAQTLVAAGVWPGTTAYYPNIFFTQYDYSNRRSTVYFFNVETKESRELFTIEPEVITMMMVHPEDQSLWISGIEAWNYDNPVDRDPPRIFRWDINAETLEDLTPQLPNLRSPACEANMANLTLQMIDLERNRLLLHCDFPLDDKVRGELYFYDLTTSEKVFLGRHEERFYYRGLTLIEQYNRHFFQTLCEEWTDRKTKTCYWAIDGPTPELVYQSWDGTRINGPTDKATADNLVYQNWLVGSHIFSTATNLQTLEYEMLPRFPVYPEGIACSGRLFPRILTWIEGYDVGAWSGYWLQANQWGHVFLTDRDTMIHRQVTCLDGYGMYGFVFFLPGDPTGHWALILSKAGNTLMIHLKDLRAAGIMSEDGRLLPAPARK